MDQLKVHNLSIEVNNYGIHEFHIDGSPMLKFIGSKEASQVLSGGRGIKPLSDQGFLFKNEDRRDWLISKFKDRQWYDYAPLYVCFCGDPNCQFIGTKVILTEDHVTWEEVVLVFDNYDDKGCPSPGTYPTGEAGPLRFDRQQYEDCINGYFK